MQSFLVQDTTVFRYTARFAKYPYANISFYDRDQKRILFHLSLRQEDGICACNRHNGENWAAEKTKKRTLPKSGVEVTLTFSPPHVTVELGGEKIFNFGRGFWGRAFPDLDQISFVSFQGGIAATDVEFGDSTGPKPTLGTLSRSNQALLAKGQLCLSNRLELRARLKTPTKIDVLTLDLPGENSPPKVILYPSASSKNSLGKKPQVTDAIVLLPGRVWKDRREGEALDIGLLHADGTAACPRLQLTRDDLLEQIELTLADTDLGKEPLAAMQVFEHVKFGALLNRLSSQAQTRLASAQRFFGLNDYFFDPNNDGHIADVTASPNTQPPPDPVGQALERFGQTMRQQPESDPIGVLKGLLADLPKDVNGGVKFGHCGGAKVGQFGASALERAALI